MNFNMAEYDRFRSWLIETQTQNFLTRPYSVVHPGMSGSEWESAQKYKDSDARLKELAKIFDNLGTAAFKEMHWFEIEVEKVFANDKLPLRKYAEVTR